MTTRYITLLAETSHAITISVTTAQIFVQIYKRWRRSNCILKGHIKIKILHSWSFHMKFTKLAKSRCIKFISTDHQCKILNIVPKKAVWKTNTVFFCFRFFVKLMVLILLKLPQRLSKCIWKLSYLVCSWFLLMCKQIRKILLIDMMFFLNCIIFATV